jgi:hypothetical protein
MLEITSIQTLKTALRLLLRLSLAVFIFAALLVLVAGTGDDLKFSADNRMVLFGPLLLIWFVAAMIVLPIGLFLIIKWTIITVCNVRKDIPMRKYWFNPFNAIIWQQYLTPKGREARRKVLDGVIWACASAIIAVMLLLLQMLAGVEI